MRRVIIGGKVDIDTCGAALLLGVSREDEVVVVRGDAPSTEDLANPEVICIEVGGSGQWDLNNWDHHGQDCINVSAVRQAFLERTAGGIDQDLMYHFGPYGPMVEYIDILDTQGPDALRQRVGKDVEFPTLSDCFAGMLLSERNPVEQLHKGIELLAEVVKTGQNPFGTIVEFGAYAEAKARNDAQIAKAVETAQWDVTRAGRKLGFLETDFFGAPGALYGKGAEIVVAFAPQFGNPPVPKFTVAGNGIKVNSALPALLEKEEGWGGPPTGTILGSPRTGSSLTLEEVVEIVKTYC